MAGNFQLTSTVVAPSSDLKINTKPTRFDDTLGSPFGTVQTMQVGMERSLTIRNLPISSSADQPSNPVTQSDSATAQQNLPVVTHQPSSIPATASSEHILFG